MHCTRHAILYVQIATTSWYWQSMCGLVSIMISSSMFRYCEIRSFVTIANEIHMHTIDIHNAEIAHAGSDAYGTVSIDFAEVQTQ